MSCFASRFELVRELAVDDIYAKSSAVFGDKMFLYRDTQNEGQFYVLSQIDATTQETHLGAASDWDEERWNGEILAFHVDEDLNVLDSLEVAGVRNGGQVVFQVLKELETRLDAGTANYEAIFVERGERTIYETREFQESEVAAIIDSNEFVAYLKEVLSL